MPDERLTPAQYGVHLARLAPDLTSEQVEAAARILASLTPSDAAPPVPALMTTADVAHMFGVKPDRILRWSAMHRWPHIKVGQTYRFRREDIDAILRKHLQNPAAMEQPRRRRGALPGQTERSARYWEGRRP